MNCPFCKRIMDHTGTKYRISTKDSTFEICPICYVRIAKGEHYLNKISDRINSELKNKISNDKKGADRP